MSTQETKVQMTEADQKRVVAGFVDMLATAIEDALCVGDAEGGNLKKGCRQNRSKEAIERLLGE